MSDKMTRDGVITLVSITGVNALNYGLNLILGRWLGPEGFAEASILATLVLILSFIGVAVQITSAKETASMFDSSLIRDQFLQFFEKRSMILGCIISVILISASIWIADFLQMQSVSTLVIVFVGIPFYLGMSARRGFYQGKQQFLVFSMSFVIETLVRISVTLGGLYFALIYAPEYITHVVAFGFLSSFLACYLYTLIKHKIQLGELPKLEKLPKALWIFIASIGVYELSQILINNCDVILVKHYFDEYAAGIYASIALVGRMVYFGTWTIVTLLFPKVIEKEKKGESHTGLFYGSLGIVVACGLIITSVCMWQGAWIMQVLFGDAYTSGADLLWFYALSTTIFAAANVFAYYYMSLDKYLPVAISLAAGIIQILGVSLFHVDLEQVIFVQIVVMSGLLCCMVGFHVVVQMK